MLAKRLLPGLAVALFALLVIYNTNLNNAYYYGATLHDWAMFATATWRAGWTLAMAPVLGSQSYLTIHFSPLLLVPNALSYIYPGDMISFNGLVYGAVYAGLVYACYTLLLRVGVRPVWAALGSFLLFVSQPVVEGAWETRMEVVAPVFAIMTFWAWQERRYRAMFIWHGLNALLREDMAMVFGIPLALLAFAQWVELRRDNIGLARERAGWGIIAAVFSVTCTATACLMQKLFFPGFDIIDLVYFSKEGPFAHLSLDMLLHRLLIILEHSPGIWLPIVAVAIAAVLFADAQLLAGAVAFLPFLLVNFISKNEISGVLGSYKAFPLALLIVWPAFVLLTRGPQLRRRYLILQAVVLVCGVSSLAINDGTKRLNQWFPDNYYTQNASQYQDFSFDLEELVRKYELRASHGVQALYPYRFRRYTQSSIHRMTDEDFNKINMLVWFEGDRDQAHVDKWLKIAKCNISEVRGTKIRIGHRIEERPPQY